MFSSNLFNKLFLATATASICSLALVSAPAEAARFFSFEGTDSPIAGDFLIDENTPNDLSLPNSFFGIYGGAISEFSAGSFNLRNLDFQVQNTTTDSVSIFRDASELATFTFDDNLQFADAGNLGNVLDSLDGSTATLTSSRFISLSRQVRFYERNQEPRDIPEPTTTLGFLAVSALGGVSILKKNLV